MNDHVNRHLLGGAYPFMNQMGRLAMPMFAFILAYNLARPGALANGTALRVLQRLIPFAVVSSLPYMELNLFWAAALIAFMLMLRFDNGNFWAMAALPVFVLGSCLRIPFPRWRNALYYYYPLHLVVIVALKIMVFGN